MKSYFVQWSGEDRDDRGRIVVKDSEVKTQTAHLTYEDE